MSGIYRTILFIAVVALVASCKKGENDPFLSLNSRKARMHGDWDISAMQYNERTTTVDNDFVDVTRTFHQGVITQITTNHIETGDINTYDTVITEMSYFNITFDRNGTWRREMNTISTWTNLEIVGGSYEYDTVVTTTNLIESGDWSFLGALKGEFKNKERIVMNVLTREKQQQINSYYTEISQNDTLFIPNIGDQTTDILNFYSGEQSTTIEIDQLKKKEMIFIEKRRQSGSLTILPYQGISTTSENDQFYSDMHLTLSRK